MNNWESNTQPIITTIKNIEVTDEEEEAWRALAKQNEHRLSHHTESGK